MLSKASGKAVKKRPARRKSEWKKNYAFRSLNMKCLISLNTPSLTVDIFDIYFISTCFFSRKGKSSFFQMHVLFCDYLSYLFFTVICLKP